MTPALTQCWINFDLSKPNYFWSFFTLLTKSRQNNNELTLVNKSTVVHGLGRSTVHPPPQLINFMVILRYLYTLYHYQIHTLPKYILEFFFSISLYLYPTGSKSWDFCDSIVCVSKPTWDSMCKQTKHIKVTLCSPISQFYNGTKKVTLRVWGQNGKKYTLPNWNIA